MKWKTSTLTDELNKVIDEFTKRMTNMMPGHKQDIEKMAENMKKDYGIKI